MSRHNDMAVSRLQEETAIADAFVRARLRAEALQGFPGKTPRDLVTAYRVQDLAIARWPDAIAGWKIGYIPPPRRDRSGDERLLGPVFRRQVWPAAGNPQLPVFRGGSAAVEAEFVLRLLADAPPDKMDWSADEAAQLPAELFLGIEVASSPLASINQLGPCVVASDFGNNNGLVLGGEIPGWRDIPERQLRASTWIDGSCVGTGGAAMLPGGLLAAYAFALSRSARRGHPLRAGELVATGNATGIHGISAGQRVRVEFDGFGVLEGVAVAAAPVAVEAGG